MLLMMRSRFGRLFTYWSTTEIAILSPPLLSFLERNIDCVITVGDVGSKARFRSKKVLVFGVMEDVTNDEYSARS